MTHFPLPRLTEPAHPVKHYLPLLQPAALLTYLMSFLIGSLYAQTLPTLSVYIVERYQITPFYLGVFFVSLAASAMTVSQIVGVLSDKGMSRLWLIFAGMVAGALACAGFALSAHYWQALACGVFIYSFSAMTLPQIMAQGREYADQHFAAQQVPLFNAILRASFALAWVAGPPIGFYFQHTLGSINHYLSLSIAYLGVGIMAWFLLPKVQRAKVKPSKVQAPNVGAPPVSDDNHSGRIPFNLKLGFVACAILFGVNHSYIIALPQLLEQHLHIPIYNTGYILGAAAALEIPIMLLGGWLAARLPVLPLVRIGAAAAASLYLGVWLANSLWQLIALQIFNAVFIGFVAGLGMTWFQDQMPHLTGTASSLFSNAINLGNILGSLLIGLMAAWVGYQHLYLANTLCALIAVALLFFCKNK